MMENVSIFDIALLSLIVIFGVKGLISGIIKETFGLIGIIGGIFFASRFAQKAGDFIDANIYHINNKASIYFIGFIAILLIIWLSSIVIGFIFTKLVNLSGLGFTNKLLGFIVGSLKIFLLFSIVIFALRSIDIFRENIDSKLKKSYSYPYLITIGNYIVKFKLEDVNKTINTMNKKVNNESSAVTDK